MNNTFGFLDLIHNLNLKKIIHLTMKAFFPLALANCYKIETQSSPYMDHDCSKTLILPQCKETIQKLILDRQMGFHITAQENVASIMEKGLLTSFGGVKKDGICKISGQSPNPNVNAESTYYCNQSLGHIFFAKELDTIAALRVLYVSSSKNYSVIGIRLDQFNGGFYEKDPDYKTGGFRTKSNIDSRYLINFGSDLRKIKDEYFPKKRFLPCLGHYP
jgi:hypothetical protein